MGEPVIFDTAPLAGSTIVFTVFLVAIFILFGMIPVIIYRVRPHPGTAVWATVHLFVFMGLIGACFLSVPRAYVITQDAIVVTRWIGDLIIDREDIVSVTEADHFMWEGKNGWNAGVFGFVGTYRSPGFGKFTACLTNWKRLVVITRKSNNPVVISPDRPASFVFSVKSHAP